MRTTLTAALLLLTATTAPFEEDWVKVSESEDGTTSYVEGSSIRTSGAIRRYWMRMDLVKDPDGWGQFRMLRESNCATDQTRTLHLIAYKGDGTHQAADASVGPWDYAAPETRGAYVHNYVCGK